MANSDITITITAEFRTRVAPEPRHSNAALFAAWASFADLGRDAVDLAAELERRRLEQREAEHAEALTLNHACALARHAYREAVAADGHVLASIWPRLPDAAG